MMTPEEKKTMEDLLKLVKGEHETLVIVPRKSTEEMIVAGNAIRDGYDVEDRSTRYIYEAMIQASQKWANAQTISATPRKRSKSPVTEEDARKALNHFFDSNPPPKHIEETIRKCLQAHAGGK